MTAVRRESIDADFLSALLGRRVDGVTSTPIGTGQVGATYRFELDGEDVPATLVGKFAAPDAFTRETAIAQGSYRRETGFYQSIATPALPVPEVLHVGFDEGTHDFALLMRDLPDHRAGDQLTPLDLPRARACVEALARIHAATWDDARLLALPYLPGSDDYVPAELDPLYGALWPAFVERYRDRVTPAMIRVGDAYVGRCEAWAARRPGARCLVHGDFRHDNLLFGPQGDVVVVDWQTAAIGSGATDLAYFAGTSLAVEDRRAHEGELFDLWLGGLCAHPTDRDELWRGYRHDAFAGFLMGVAASMIVGRTERGDAMFLAMCERAAAMVLDHDAAALL